MSLPLGYRLTANGRGHRNRSFAASVSARRIGLSPSRAVATWNHRELDTVPVLLQAAAMRIWSLLVFLGAVGCTATVGSGGGGTECEPGGSGQCQSGEHCSPQGTCEPGCATEGDCAAGQGCCDGQCVDTSSDAASCGACGNACGPGTDCCEGTCVNLATLTDCGTCGNTCSAGEFCDGSQCNTATYPNFCANKTVYVIHDGIPADEQAADLMASTIAANCPPDVVVQTRDQTDPTLVDQTTGQPLAGSGVTYVMGGGPFPNKPLRWLERTQKVTSIYFDAPDGINFFWRRRADDVAVAMMPANQCAPGRDQFITELVTDPMSGTLSLVGYGACSGGKGTVAAAWHYANVILPNRAMYPDSWYVFSWVDQNQNAAPDAGDAFAVLAQGM